MSKNSEKFSNTFISVLAFLLAVVITFSVVMTAQTFAETAKQNNQVVVNSRAQQESNNESVSDDDSSISDVGGVDEPTDVITPDEPSDSEEKPDENKEPDSAFASTEELVAYFNECANKVKTDATKVVKNSEKRVVGEIKVPDVLQSMAEKLLSENMKDDTKPIDYSTKEEIRDNSTFVESKSCKGIIKIPSLFK